MLKGRADGASLAVCAAALGVFLLCRFYPAHLPFFFPFIFNAPVFLGTWFTLLWYFRGLRRVSAGQRPGGFRQGCFLIGVLAIYAVLQTHFEYLSQHLFSLNRVQAVTLGMAAPFLIGIAWMRDVLGQGAPARITALCRSRAISGILRLLRQPLAAAALYLLATNLWLIPSVHFAAMINPALYAVMNLSCLLGGLNFWLLVLDPRPPPLARLSFIGRAALGFLVMFPQVAISAYIALTPRDLYAFYTLCGRIFPAISPAYDQMLGGMIQWIPPGMMNVAAMILALNAMRLSDAEADKHFTPPPGAKIFEAKWTGR